MERQRNPRFAELMARLRERQDPPSINQLSHVTRLTNAMTARLLDGYQPTWQAAYKVATAYPDMAEEIFQAAGYPMPVDLVPEFARVVEGDGPSREELEHTIRRLLQDG